MIRKDFELRQLIKEFWPPGRSKQRLREAARQKLQNLTQEAQPGSGFAGGSEGFKLDLNSNSLRQRPLSAPELDVIRANQASQALSSAPMHVIFVVCSVLAIAGLAQQAIGFYAVAYWLALALLPPLVIVGLILKQQFGKPSKPEFCIRFIEAAAFGEAMAFLVPLALFAPVLPEMSRVFLFGSILLLVTIAAVSLVRVPVAAIVTSTLLLGATAASAYLGLPDFSLAAAMMIGTYGLALMGIIVNTHWDFLKQEHAEIELLRQQQMVSILLNDFERNTSDWMWETDTEGRLTYFSPQLATALGKSQTDIRGQRLIEAVPNAKEVEAWQNIDRAMSVNSEIPGVVAPFSHAGQTSFWHMTAKVVRGKDGAILGYRGITRDISEKWRADLDAREARESAERASSAKSQFLTVVGHEIKTPINAIVGFADLLMRDTDGVLPQSARVEYLDQIQTNALSLQHLIGNILDATRLEKGAIRLNEEDVDASEVIESALRGQIKAIERQDLRVSAQLPEAVILLGDGQRLMQVVANLIDNAVKFSIKGGLIRCDVKKGLGGEFVLSIRDAGSGFPDVDVDRIFDPFTQGEQGLARSHGGLGLGLSIARKIARLHGGDVSLTSVPGAGADARLTLPPSRVRWPDMETQDTATVAA